MQSPAQALIGAILERNPRSAPSTPSPRVTLSGKTGFPAVQHRSKSAFSRTRAEERRRSADRPQQVPLVHTAPRDGLRSPETAIDGSKGGAEVWRRQIDEENRRRVEGMTEDEREEERKEILERFGPNVGDILRKAREARETPRRKQEETQGIEEISHAPSISTERAFAAGLLHSLLLVLCNHSYLYN